MSGNKPTKSLEEIKQSIKEETEKALEHWENLSEEERESIDKETTIGTPENLVRPDKDS
ncbi:hypothetical protein ACJJIQ_09175 [Microbulbifer sp. ANSA003]|uniref:hypothetical protein n=1 Tax=Microbulbifer sp. ANSA003 TaxID=3243360 RepID=UPI004042D073